MGKFAWNHNVDYDEARRMLASMIAGTRYRTEKTGPDVRGAKPSHSLGASATLLVQLANASRVSEAADAVRIWKETGDREVQVRIRKLAPILTCVCGKKFSKKAIKKTLGVHQSATGHIGSTEAPDPETRLMEIPEELFDSDRSLLVPVSGDAARKYCKRATGWNSHSLRYSQITRMGKNGESPQVIAGSTGHRDLSFILDYTSQLLSNETLRRYARAPAKEPQPAP